MCQLIFIFSDKSVSLMESPVDERTIDFYITKTLLYKFWTYFVGSSDRFPVDQGTEIRDLEYGVVRRSSR